MNFLLLGALFLVVLIYIQVKLNNKLNKLRTQTKYHISTVTNALLNSNILDELRVSINFYYYVDNKLLTGDFYKGMHIREMYEIAKNDINSASEKGELLFHDIDNHILDMYFNPEASSTKEFKMKAREYCNEMLDLYFNPEAASTKAFDYYKVVLRDLTRFPAKTLRLDIKNYKLVFWSRSKGFNEIMTRDFRLARDR